MPNPLRVTSRSGATDAEVAAALPGDDLVPDAIEAMDRAATFPVPIETLWPWILQLGKGRAGWYLPRGVEMLIPRSRRASRVIEPRWQQLQIGEDVPDWGPGDPVLRCVAIDPPTVLVWHSLRDRDNSHRWPATDGPHVMAISWVLVLRPVPTGTRLHIRLRVRAKHAWLARLGGIVDWLTIVGMFRGLRERVLA